MGNSQNTSERIICCFHLGPPFVLAGVPSRIEKEETIYQSDATEERWTFWVEFSDIGAASDMFDYFSNQYFDLDVEWMVKGVNQFSKCSDEEASLQNSC